jgi:hypothetical protein
VGLKQVQFAQLGTCPAQVKIIQDKSILKERSYTAVGMSFSLVLGVLIEISRMISAKFFLSYLGLNHAFRNFRSWLVEVQGVVVWFSDINLIHQI